MSGTPVASVLVIGESLIDIVERRGVAPEEHVGGSPANVALGLGRLGRAVRLRTALGRDERGRRIKDHLEAGGVVVDGDSFSLERTSTARAVIGGDGSAQYDFDLSWRLENGIETAGVQFVHVGSVACFLEPGATSILTFLEKARGNVQVSFDPNIRSEILTTHAGAARRVAEICALSDVVKLSDEDAAWLYPGRPAEEVLTRILESGPRLAVMTKGADGAVLSSEHGTTRVAAPTVRIRDTVGAGDTYMACLIDQMLDDPSTDPESLQTLGNRAAVAAAITVSRAGADLPTRQEVDRGVLAAR
ncbi:hypothetical protein LK09_14680 [Microbacterium mangrovi]|uniref:Carbohydrate kinase PfkB domain-containing protein n=1 Tax=Microbacterium mangrovi TaxID=1348253 RepID=A0A0B1ZZB6_9MICO|nr:carbohydrate kinase [Microbacterium mangrovi]KHK96580.1 hypothetical protein LK09_14680 [Microbacterium mangrovi]